MNTKLIMTISALILGVLGLVLTFMPEETASYMGLLPERTITIIFQLLGALYFAFAMINWSIRDGRIGGIYNKPIAIGNFTHFMIGGIALVKAITTDSDLPIPLIGLCVIYLVFGILFGLITFKHPLKEDE